MQMLLGGRLIRVCRGMTEVSSVSKVPGKKQEKREQLCSAVAGAWVRPPTTHRMACCDATPLKNLIGDCD